MSLNNNTLYNDNPNNRVSFDPTQTNFLQNATDVDTALLALDQAITDFDQGTEIAFDPTGTDLVSTNVESAIKEHNPRIQSLEAEYSNTNINSANDIKTELFALADTNNLTDALQTQIGTNTTNISTNTTDISNLDSRVTTAETDINNLELSFPQQSLTSASAVKTVYESNADTNAFSDALLSKLNGIEPLAKDDQNASEVPYDNTTSGMTASNVQTALDEVDSRLDTVESSTASNVPYDNSTSGLTATFVQGAIDEVEGRVDTAETKLATIETGATQDQTGAEIKALYELEANAFTDAQFTKLAGIEPLAKDDQIASEVPYTNTTSGLLATDVQGAIDEIAQIETGVSILGQSRQVVDHRLDVYSGGIQLGAGPDTLDNRSNGGVGTAGALEYTTYGTLGTWNRGTFTATSDGTYHYRWVADGSTNSGTLVHNYELRKNGTTVVFETQYTTNAGRSNANEIDTYVELATNDTLAVYIGSNQTAGLFPETMYYNVEKVLSIPGLGQQTTVSAFYDNVTTSQAGIVNTPVSLYQLDSNFKLTLTPGKWLIMANCGVRTNSEAPNFFLSASLSSGTALANIVAGTSSIIFTGRNTWACTAIVEPSVTTDYTMWVVSDSTANWYESNPGTVLPDPDNQPSLHAINLASPIVGNAGAVSYNPVTSGLTETNLQSVIDRIANPKISTQSGTFVPSEDFDIYICDTSGGAVTVNLPQISSLSRTTKRWVFKDNGNATTNNITINRNGTDTIDGQTSSVIATNYSSLTLVSDGSSWWLVV